MTDSWSSSLPWASHQRGLARWAARKWGWREGDEDWPSALALLACAEDEGHTALDWNRASELWDRRFAVLASAPRFCLPPPELWPAVLFSEGWLVRRRVPGADLIQTARNADLESRLFAALTALAQGNDAEAGVGQEAAVARAGKTRFLILAGGPGTGKTTTLRGLIGAWTDRVPGLRTVVAAPTGRAAARARESFAETPGRPECLTLHRLLGLRPGLGDPWHGPHRPLPFDLVVVDEASMVDLRTAVALTAALAPGASLVLVGDPGQLPSVEAGSVLADVLARPEFAGSTVRLTTRHRLAQDTATLARVFDLLQEPVSDPEAAAAALREWGDGRAPDFRWTVTEPAEDPGPAALAAWGSPRNLALADLADRILLSPVHQGPGGTETLGHLLDRQLGRPPGTVGPGLPWMITRNLRHLDLSNGDRGLVILQDESFWFQTMETPVRTIPFSLVREDGVPAWAVTVHKSQGSEFAKVVLVLPPGLKTGTVRELVYTGLTRARSRAVLVGSRQALVAALGRTGVRTSGFGLRD